MAKQWTKLCWLKVRVVGEEVAGKRDSQIESVKDAETLQKYQTV